jgi:hypothetical protein
MGLMRLFPPLAVTLLLAACGPAFAADPPSCVPDTRSKACLAARAALKECETVARTKLDALARRNAGRTDLSTGEKVAIRQEQERITDEQASCEQGVR